MKSEEINFDDIDLRDMAIAAGSIAFQLQNDTITRLILFCRKISVQ